MPRNTRKQAKRMRVESPVDSDADEVDQLLPSGDEAPQANSGDLVPLPKTWGEVRSTNLISGLSEEERAILRVRCSIIELYAVY